MPPSHIGKYEVKRRLGAGGMGSLYLARDPGLDRLVAIKLLKDEYQDDPELRERFIREARSVARLRHENIIIVFDIGEADGLPFMAMEYIAGETVAQVLRRTPTPSLSKRLVMVEELCAGLAHAHAAGIIHRDIKPANLMITGEGVLKVLDFGIARLADSGMTQGGMMLGTVNYMSPEQVAGPTVDHRSDIFATGAVLYELVTLQQAFPGRIDSGVLNRILNDGPVPIEELIPGVDPDLAAIVRRALERDPNHRYQHASEMGRDVARVRRRLADAPPADPVVLQNTTVAERPRPSSGAVKRGDSSRPRVLSDERFAELQRQQVEEHLRFGDAAFAKGDHDAALHYGERAAMVDPESRAAIDLITRARFAIESKAVRKLLGEAQRQLADGLLDDAAALAHEAAAALSHLEGASDLQVEMRHVTGQIAEAREREQRISTSLERARASIDQGGYETALRALYEVLAIDPDRAEARELERSAIARLQAQREHQRARRQAYDRLSSARQLADDSRYEEALAEIAGVDGPSDTVRMAAAAAAAEVRAQQRHAEVAALVAEARRAFERGEFELALRTIDGLPPADVSVEARTLRTDAERALRERIELERKQKVVDEGLRAVATFLESGDLAGAAAKLDDVERVGLADPRISQQREHVAALVAAAQERRRQEARDRLAAKLVDAARQLLDAGDGHAAISLLERDSSGHALVSEALRSIRATVAEQEERARQEAERRRQEEEARRRAEIEAARRREEARLAEEQRKREEERRAREAELARRREEFATFVSAAEQALAEADPNQATLLLRRADQVGRVDDATLIARAADARAEAARLEAERRRQEEEARRRAEIEAARKREEARLAEFATLVSAAEQALAEADPDQATVLLRRADQVGRIDDSTLVARAADARAEVERLEHERAEQARREAEARKREEERRRVEEEKRRAEEARRKETAFQERLERARQTADDRAALALLEDAQSILPGDGRVDAPIAERRAAIEAARAEAARLAEEARRREEEAREREAALTRILSREREEAPAAALAMLHDALTLVPGDQRVVSRIAQRNAELERQRAEEARRKEAAVVELLARARHTADHEAALELLQQAQSILPGDARVESLAAERRAALEAQRTEAARLAEEARQREEAARAREAAVTRLLSRERQEDPEAALTMLHEALTLVPGDRRVEARIEQRNADLERRRAEEERQQQIAAAVAAVGVALDRQDLDGAGQLLTDGERQFAAAPFQEVRRAYDARRREEARVRREAEEAERRRLAREEKEARERQAREEKEARERAAREKRERARQEKEEAARRRREEREAQRTASGAPTGRPAWTSYAAAATVALLVGGGAWALWPRTTGSDTPGGPASSGGPASGGAVGSVPGSTPPPAGATPSQPPTRGDAPSPQTGSSRAGNTVQRGGQAPAGNGGQPSAGGETPEQQAARERAAQLARDEAARDQAARDQAARDQAARDAARDQAAREQAAKEQAARDLAAREQAAREQAQREQAAREQAVAAAQARERTAIQQLVNDYVSAYTALDERRLRQLVAGFPGIPGRPLIKSVELRLSNQRIEVSPDGQTATVTATQNFEYVWNRAGADRTATGQLNWRLRKNNGAWTVLP